MPSILHRAKLSNHFHVIHDAGSQVLCGSIRKENYFADRAIKPRVLLV
jgi:hypothetical protein